MSRGGTPAIKRGMNAVQRRLVDLVEHFASELVRLVATASIDDLARLAASSPTKPRPQLPEESAPAPRPRGRPRKSPESTPVASSQGRRTEAQIEKLQERAVEHVTSHAGTEGVSSREIAKALRVPVGLLTRPLFKALKAGLIRKQGERQFTRYFAAN